MQIIGIFLPFIILAAILWFMYVFFRNLIAGGKPGEYWCTTCHHDAKAAKRPGSIWIEIVLWLFFIIPGVIYSIWRLASSAKVCPHCGMATLIPAAVKPDTPKPITRTEKSCPHCAEPILAQAKVCKHCGRDV